MVEGDRTTWKQTCTGAMAMSGEGEIIRQGDDAYTGAIKFLSDEGNMTIQISGQRLGDCDAPG